MVTFSRSDHAVVQILDLVSEWFASAGMQASSLSRAARNRAFCGCSRHVITRSHTRHIRAQPPRLRPLNAQRAAAHPAQIFGRELPIGSNGTPCLKPHSAPAGLTSE